jgi:hypothetical protein
MKSTPKQPGEALSITFDLSAGLGYGLLYKPVLGADITPVYPSSYPIFKRSNYRKK